MSEWYASLTSLEALFFYCAVLGTVLFLMRLVMLFIGGDSEGIGDDLPEDIPDDFPDDPLDTSSSDVSFRYFSIQGITAFFMIFGLVGLCMKRDFESDNFQAVGVGVLAGSALMIIQARLMTLMMRLQASGNVKAKSAMGKEGTVYLEIPEEGIGKVQVVVQNQLKIYNATTRTGGTIKTGTPIKVVEVVGVNTLIVETQ